MLKILTLFCILFFVTACGFHLHGYDTVPPQLQTLYYTTGNPYGSFELSLKDSLHAAKVTLTETQKQAPFTLKVLKTSFTHDMPSIGDSTQARIYIFTYRASFEITDAKGKMIVPPQALSTSRRLVVGPNQVLDATHEVKVINQEMEDDVVHLVFDRLGAKRVIAALNKAKSL